MSGSSSKSPAEQDAQGFDADEIRGSSRRRSTRSRTPSRSQRSATTPRTGRSLKRSRRRRASSAGRSRRFENLIHGTPEKLRSHMRITHSTIVNLLARPRAGIDTIRDFLERTTRRAIGSSTSCSAHCGSGARHHRRGRRAHRPRGRTRRVPTQRGPRVRLRAESAASVPSRWQLSISSTRSPRRGPWTH